jgi:hypothetical protein
MSGNKRIASEWLDDQTGMYFVELVTGWESGEDPWAPLHVIVAPSKREAYQVLRNAKPCSCPECNPDNPAFQG